MASKERVSALPRASVNLTLNFGLVSINVAMAPALKSSRDGIKGRLLCPEHHQPVSQFYSCEEGEEPHTMTKGGTITGYETAPKSGEFVTLDEGLVEQFVEERTGGFEIVRFAPASTVSPLFFRSAYLCWAGEKAGEQFDLLSEILRTQKVVAVAKGVLRKQTGLVAFAWEEAIGAMVAYSCAYETNIRWGDVELVQNARAGREQPKKVHLEAAKPLVAQLDGGFDPSEVEDTYTDALRDAIAATAAGQKPKAKAAAKAPGTTGSDLLAALEASVQEASGKAEGNGAKKPARKRTAKAKA